MPPIVNLSRHALPAIRLIWVLEFVKALVAQGATPKKLLDDGRFAQWDGVCR